MKTQAHTHVIDSEADGVEFCGQCGRANSVDSARQHTPTDMAMENIAILDLLTREGWSEGVINRVERAVNSYEKSCKWMDDAYEELSATLSPEHPLMLRWQAIAKATVR